MDIGNLFLRVFAMSRHTGNIDQMHDVNRKLFGRAESSIRIVVGELVNPFYADSETLEAIKEARGRGVSIELVHGPQRDNNCATVLQQQGVKLHELAERPVTDFTLVDGRHAKV